MRSLFATKPAPEADRIPMAGAEEKGKALLSAVTWRTQTGSLSAGERGARHFPKGSRALFTQGKKEPFVSQCPKKIKQDSLLNVCLRVRVVNKGSVKPF